MANTAVFIGGPINVSATGAMSGDGTITPLAVRVDATTITINGADALETIGITNPSVDGATTTFALRNGLIVGIS